MSREVFGTISRYGMRRLWCVFSTPQSGTMPRCTREHRAILRQAPSPHKLRPTHKGSNILSIHHLTTLRTRTMIPTPRLNTGLNPLLNTLITRPCRMDAFTRDTARREGRWVLSLSANSASDKTGETFLLCCERGFVRAVEGWCGKCFWGWCGNGL